MSATTPTLCLIPEVGDHRHCVPEPFPKRLILWVKQQTLWDGRQVKSSQLLQVRNSLRYPKKKIMIIISPLLDSLLTYLLKALGGIGIVTSGIERRAHVKVARATLWFELLNAVGVLQGQVVHA